MKEAVMAENDNENQDVDTDVEQDETGDATEEVDSAALVKDDGTPVTQADWAALQEALRKARKDARTATRRKPAADEVEKADVDKVAAEAAAAAAGKYKPMVVKAAARTAFVEAGLTLPKDNVDSAMGRALRLLDLDDIDVSDDGEVDGLREQVEDIRRDFPELFTTTRKVATGRADGAERGTASSKPRSSADMLAALINS